MGRLTITSALLVTTALLCVGCSSSQPEEAAPAPVTTTARTIAPEEDTMNSIADGNCLNPEDIDTSNPDALSRGYVIMTYCWDSVHDRTLTAASIRAKELMTEEFAQRQVEPERNAAQGMFNQAYKHQAYSQPSVTLSPTEVNSQDTENSATRVYLVEWDWIGRDGTTSTGGKAIASVGMVKEGDTWKVSGSATDGFVEERS